MKFSGVNTADLSPDAEALLESNFNKIDWNQFLRHLNFDWTSIEICLFYKVGFEKNLKIQKNKFSYTFHTIILRFS